MTRMLKNILEGMGFGAAVAGGVTLMICFVCIFGIIGIFVWPYAINSWLIYFGKLPQVVWWQGFLLGLFPPLGITGILLAVATWLTMMFLR